MQRVAIARALVNDPDIILADEPTGALDSVTSVQIMELIKEIAKDKLVIMVTHNSELAYTYANRIVEFKDGEVIEDTNPINDKEKNESKYTIKKTAMSFSTALKLSFNNIKTKKGRTILTAFASSIGIIGIALVLSLSNGFDKQIDKFETETLSSLPILISKEAMSVTEDSILSLRNKNDENKFTSEEYIFPRDSILEQLTHNNEFSEEYLNYINNLNKDNVLGLSYTRLLSMNVLGKVEGRTVVIPTSLSLSSTSITSMQTYFEAMPAKLDKDKDGVVEKNYDVLKGRLPQSKEELVLIVDNSNKVDKKLVSYLGLDATQKKISFDDIIGREFKLILNEDFYVSLGNIYTVNINFDALYDSDKAVTLKVVGIIRAKEESKLYQQGAGIAYTEDLVDFVLNENKNSGIVKLQEAVDYNVLTGEKIDLTTKEGRDTKQYILQVIGGDATPFAISIYSRDFDAKNEIVEYLDKYNEGIVSNLETHAKSYLNYLVENIKDNDDTLLRNVDNTIQEVSPILVNLVYKDNLLNGNINFDGAEFVVEDSKIKSSTGGVTYTDLSETLVSLSGSIMDAITYVLVGFSSISLVVSSIMIGIITYISVLERTKEIGILRALGARKKDITRVFNAETFIIGITSGLIGIFIAVLLTIPINAILYSLTELKNVAQLNPLHALLLIIVSMTLTIIGGLIPAHVASKKDPVEALRTE
ncbi:MAG: FtsX-like permease family protein [Bacilli bacterium]|nr:FtsX-like permease family protein [Bacilli bacterium]